ncbi:MAG: pyridoxal 5'-phosphate synthase glutaminase subunit PdxT [Candidatus Latescibacteria bacterium]|nr:pyridoxal 5'-phosphate synthase glutaminase subunit PdxT [Candidatus Latescibacterota bacterium]
MSDARTRPVIGTLAMQGDFAAHAATMEGLGVEVRPIRKVSQLAELDGLVIPGGESTTLIKLLDAFDFWDPLQVWIDAGHPVLGTCAGAILLAREVLNPSQKSFGLIDITVERNSYGRQADSFEGSGTFRLDGDQDENEIEMVFIRAPRITRVGDGVETLGVCRGDTVVARQGNVMVCTFHPELSAGSAVHELFLRMVFAAR